MNTISKKIDSLVRKGEYDQAAAELMDHLKIQIAIHFSHNGTHFSDSDRHRDIYIVTITRGRRSFQLRFGQSLSQSQKLRMQHIGTDMIIECSMDGEALNANKKWNTIEAAWQATNYKNKAIVKGEEPSYYSVLSCLVKYDPEEYIPFCNNFDYDPRMISSQKLYDSVKEEYNKMCMLFSDEELELLDLIQ